MSPHKPAPGREETARWFASHLVHRAGERLTPEDWAGLADSFAEDADYFDSTYGHKHGREAIRQYLHDSMVGLEEWTFPIQWVEIGEGRAIAHLLNRAPGRRADGSFHEFPSVTIVHYDHEGRIVLQRDLYDRLDAVRVFTASKLGGLRGRVRRLLGRR